MAISWKRRMDASVSVGLVVALVATGCVEVGPVKECELPEPRCSEIAADALHWASMATSGPAVVRIRVLNHGGYEIHYADGTVEAAVP